VATIIAITEPTATMTNTSHASPKMKNPAPARSSRATASVKRSARRMGAVRMKGTPCISCTR
jgi:hypothetical protein